MKGIIGKKGIEMRPVADVMRRLETEFNARAQFKWSSYTSEKEHDKFFGKDAIYPYVWRMLRLLELARDEYFGEFNRYTVEWPEGVEESALVFPMQYTLDGMGSSDFTWMARKEYDKKVLDGFDKEKFFDEIANPLAALDKAIAALRYECVPGRLKCWVFRYGAKDGGLPYPEPVKDQELTAYKNAMNWARDNWLSTKSGESDTDRIKASFKVTNAGIGRVSSGYGYDCWEIAIPYVVQSRYRDTCVYIKRSPPAPDTRPKMERKNIMTKCCFFKNEAYTPESLFLGTEDQWAGIFPVAKELGWGSFTEKKIMLDDHTEKEDGETWYCSPVLFPVYEDNLGMTFLVTLVKHDRAKEIIANGGTVPGYTGL